MSDMLLLGLVACLAPILTVLVPIVRARQDNLQKNIERKAAEDRQDQIADRLAAKVSETARHASTAREAISSKLDDVKTLVNGNITDLLRDKHDGLAREVALIEENRDLRLALNLEIAPTEAATLELARTRLREARAQLDFKKAADRAVDGDHP